jgi:high affinity sulfate transporter 1
MALRAAPPAAAAALPRRVLGLQLFEGILPMPSGGVSPQVVAGFTLAALGIPEVMGYSKIAGMPVVTGLYTILVPIAVFAVIGSSRHLIVGADSATAAILAAGLAGMASQGSSQYVALAGMLALITAGILVLARLLRLGFIANFLSRSVLIGFLTGVGIQVAMGQLAGMLGVSSGTGGTIAKFVHTLEHVRDASGWTVGVSVVVIAVILGLKRVSPKIPGALIAVVGMIVSSRALDFASHGVSELGPVPGGLPSIGFPSVPFHDVAPLVATAVSIFVVILAQSAATSRAYASRYQEHLDENTDMIGLGMANLTAGLTGAFVVNGSPTKTEIADSAGGRNQIVSLTTAVVVLVVLLFLTKPLQYMPNAVLASVVFLIGLELIDRAGLARIRRSGHIREFAVALVTAVTVVAWGVEQGIILAIVLSVVTHLARSYNPPNAVLARAGTHDWTPTPYDPVPQAEPGLVVFLWGASLYFANSAKFEEDTLKLSAGDGHPVSWLVVDGAAMGDIDYSGGETLLEVNAELKQRGVKLVFAGLIGPVRRELDRAGVTSVLGEDAFYPGLDEAVEAYRALRGRKEHQ